MKYDDASWHYGGDFPADLPREAGSTHIGMFVVWCWLNGLAGELHVEEFPDDLKLAQGRSMSPGALFMHACDEKFTDEDLNDEGNAFAQEYYADEGGLKSGPRGFLFDYAELSVALPSAYHVPDSWESFDQIAPVIDQRYAAWLKHKG